MTGLPLRRNCFSAVPILSNWFIAALPIVERSSSIPLICGSSSACEIASSISWSKVSEVGDENPKTSFMISLNGSTSLFCSTIDPVIESFRIESSSMMTSLDWKSEKIITPMTRRNSRFATVDRIKEKSLPMSLKINAKARKSFFIASYK